MGDLERDTKEELHKAQDWVLRLQARHSRVLCGHDGANPARLSFLEEELKKAERVHKKMLRRYNKVVAK